MSEPNLKEAYLNPSLTSHSEGTNLSTTETSGDFAKTSSEFKRADKNERRLNSLLQNGSLNLGVNQDFAAAAARPQDLGYGRAYQNSTIPGNVTCTEIDWTFSQAPPFAHLKLPVCGDVIKPR